MAMNANGFYLLLFLFLGSVYLFFKPVDIAQYDNSDMPMLELNNFKLYDIGTEGLNMVLEGAYGKRYSDRYEISDLNYTNNSVTEYQNMTALLAIYKDKMLYLNDNVVYRKGKELTFSSNEARYDEVLKSAYTTGAFNLKSKDGLFKGNELEFNSETQAVKAKNILATYHLNKAK